MVYLENLKITHGMCWCRTRYILIEMGNSNEAASKDSSDSSAKRTNQSNDASKPQSRDFESMTATDLVAAVPQPVNMFPQRPVAILQFRDGKWWMVQPPAIANQRDLTILTYNIWFDKSHRRRRFEALLDCVFSPKDCDMPSVVCFQVSVSRVHTPTLY